MLQAGMLMALAALQTAGAPIQFRDVAPSAGIQFVLENTPTPEKNLIETMAGGVAAFDYNGDGRPDIFFTNGAAIPSLEKSAPKYFNRLYRNQAGMRFLDVTAEAGVGGAGYSIGAAAADYDNDGRIDLFVAGVNRHVLYRNLGDGRFEDVTAKAGIRDGLWAVGAGWLDYDNDGRLDLFVANYLQWSFANNRFCGDRALDLRVYCHPRYFEGLPNALYRNRGDGTFEDVSRESGIAAHVGKGMFRDATYASGIGPLCVRRSGWSQGIYDFDNDGFKDLFVSGSHVNDMIERFEASRYKEANMLFRNQGGGTFEDASRDLLGAVKAHRGTAFADFNGDGRMDVVVSALGAPAELWENSTANGNHWLALKLIGSRSSRDGIGALIRLAGQTNHMTTSVGYCSSSHDGVRFGLGKRETVSRIEIRWPSGAVQILENVKADQILKVVEP